MPAFAKPAPVAAPAVTFEQEIRRLGDRELLGVYAARGYRPLWFAPSGGLSPAAGRLVELIETAAVDQVDPSSVPAGELTAALTAIRSDASPAARAKAELALSRGLVDYVRAMRQAPAATMNYEHELLRPSLPKRADALWAAASAPSLNDYVDQMRWMHPLYAPLRRAALSQGGEGAGLDPTVRDNLARLRALPPLGKGRSILVDAASARLWMYEDGRPVDSMKVVVGKPELPTPMLAGWIRHAIVNPYWNVPQDLVRKTIAGNVLRRGVGYLKAGGYEVLPDWSAEAQPVDPKQVDWREVASGERELRVRQLPGAGNAMGEVKFEFPNPMGIYLHDTPEKELLLEEQRQFSSGCVRLEDAERLGRWLLQSPLPEGSGLPEQKVALDQVVPIYITYLTARAEGGLVTYGPDPYGRNRGARALAQRSGTADTIVR